MKNFICLLLLILSISYAKGQNFISMIDTSLTWENAFGYYQNGNQVSPWLYYKFSTEDTIVKNDTFRKLIAYTAVDTFVMGGLREDTITKKAYGFFSGDTSSSLMYDFSLTNGSSINYPHSHRIDNLDTIKLLDNNDYKRYSLRSNWSGYSLNRTAFRNKPPAFSQACACDTFEWYDGLGSSNGVLIPNIKLISSGSGNQAFYWLPFFQDNFWKFCLSKIKRNNTVIVDFTDNFLDLSLGLSDVNKDEIRLSHDFINQYLLISIHSSIAKENLKVEFFDISGKIITIKINPDNKSNTIKVPFSEFKQEGIFICRISTKNSYSIKKVIIKK